MVDPSGTATEIRLALASHGARCAAILVTHGHFDHILGLADLAEGTGAPSFAPAGERALLEDPAAFTPPGHRTSGRGRRTTLLEGGETLDLAGIRFDVARGAGPFARPSRVRRRRRAALWRRAVRRVGRTDRLPGRRLGDAASARSGSSSARSRPTRSCTRATGRRRRSAPSSRGIRSSRSCGTSRASRRGERPREASSGRAAPMTSSRPRCRCWERVTGEIERLCGLYGFRRIVTPVFEDTALFQRTSGLGLRRRAEGDVHLLRPLRPLAHAPSGGDGADLPGLRRARDAPRAAAGEALHDRARCTATAHRAADATASTGRPRSRPSEPTIRRSTPS